MADLSAQVGQYQEPPYELFVYCRVHGLMTFAENSGVDLPRIVERHDHCRVLHRSAPYPQETPK